MKTLLYFSFLWSAVVVAQQKDTLVVPSEIQAVTVYVTGAEIAREAPINLPAGTSQLRLPGLSRQIDPNSIQVKGLKGLSLQALSFRVTHVAPEEAGQRQQALNAQLEALDVEMGQLDNQIAGLEAEQKVLEANRTIGEAQQKATLAEIREMSVYFRERITAIADGIQERKRQLAVLRRTQAELREQASRSGAQPRIPRGELLLTVQSPVAQQARLQVSYLVPDAGWVPNYELRSAGLGAPLALTYKGSVYQNTGVDWTHVPLTLSTARPSRGMQAPRMRPHYLDFGRAPRPAQAVSASRYSYNPLIRTVSGTVTDSNGLPLPGVNVIIPGTSTGTQTDFDGFYQLEVGNARELAFSYLGMHSVNLPVYASVINTELTEDATALDEVVVTAYGVSGKAAGVSLRGYASTPKPPTPLYIIDGVPVSEFVEGDLDASEIADVTTLSGSEATSLYGTRAADGVVLITTKPQEDLPDPQRTRFQIAGNQTIPSGEDFTSVPINRFTLEGSYEYVAAPVLDAQVYLTAKAKGWEALDLLPGEAQVYFESTYVGNTVLDPFTASKDLVVSLGADPNIQVQRKQERDYKSRSFSGSTRIMDRTYLLEIKNNGPSAVQLRLVDRIPISQNKEIRVDPTDTGTATYDDEKGLLTWNLDLTAGQQETKSFGFRVRFPRGRMITL